MFVPTAGESDQCVLDAVHKLISLPKPPDAIFCYNDRTALAAMKACQNEGIKVPQDIAIVGFDDIAAAAAANPSLSTVRVDKEALGRSGIELLLQKPDETPTQITVPVDLIVRDSSGHA